MAECWKRISGVAAIVLMVATAAFANHDTDCTASGGTNGPNQLDCSLPDFVALAGATTPLASSFTYVPSTDRNPVTCAVGTMSVDPPGQWLSIDTNVLDATAQNFQDVQVTADPSGLAPGIYEGTVSIVLTQGPMGPECPSPSPTSASGIVSVRLVVHTGIMAPALAPVGLGAAVAGLGLIGLYGLRRFRRKD